MKREYVRGNKKHWKDIYVWAFGRVPDEDWNEEGSCLVKNTCIMLKRNEGKLFFIDTKDRDDKVLYDVITTNPNWHEVKPWEDHDIHKSIGQPAIIDASIVHKHFVPFQKVLVRKWYDCKSIWTATLYSHYDTSIGKHYVLGFKFVEDNEIIAYEGNEDKLGNIIR